MKIITSQVISAILCIGIGGCSLIHSADLHQSRPLVFSLDVAPGYVEELFLDPSDGQSDFLVQRERSRPTAKWAPTFYVSYHSDKSGTGYYLNLSVDPRREQMYVKTRLIEESNQHVISETRLPQPYPLSHTFRVRAELSGKRVRFYVDGKLVGEEELTVEPRFLELGASSGKFNIHSESPEPPAAPD